MALRRNEKAFQVPETEADIWLQLHDIDTQIAAAEAVEPTPSKPSQLIYARNRALTQLHPKSRSMHSMKEYREIINEILLFPGLRRGFRAAGMEIFLRGPTIEVLPKAACTQVSTGLTNCSLTALC